MMLSLTGILWSWGGVPSHCHVTGQNSGIHAWVETLVHTWAPWVCAKLLLSCPTLFDTLDCSPPCSAVHGILQASTGMCCHALFQGMFLTQGSKLCLLCLLHCRWVLYHWASWEATGYHTLSWNCTQFHSTGGLSNNCWWGSEESTVTWWGEPGAITINRWKLASGKKERKSQGWN